MPCIRNHGSYCVTVLANSNSLLSGLMTAAYTPTHDSTSAFWSSHVIHSWSYLNSRYSNQRCTISPSEQRHMITSHGRCVTWTIIENLTASYGITMLLEQIPCTRMDNQTCHCIECPWTILLDWRLSCWTYFFQLVVGADAIVLGRAVPPPHVGRTCLRHATFPVLVFQWIVAMVLSVTWFECVHLNEDRPEIEIDLHGSCTASIIHKHCFRNAAWLLYIHRTLATPICYVRNCSSITHCLVCASVWNRLIPECKLSEVLDVTNPLQFTLWTPQAKE